MLLATCLTASAQTPLMTGSGIDWTRASTTVSNIFADAVDYYKLEEVGNAGRVDSLGTNSLTTAGLIQTNGVHNFASYNPTENIQSNAQVPDNGSEGIGSGASFTINFWMDSEVAGANNPVVCKWSVLQSEYAVVWNGGNLLWAARNLANNATAIITATSNPVLGTTNMITVGYDDVAQQIFFQMNGGTRQTAACVGVRRSTASFSVGSYSNNDGNFSNSSSKGWVDELAFWRRAISASEVTATLWNSGAGKFLP